MPPTVPPPTSTIGDFGQPANSAANCMHMHMRKMRATRESRAALPTAPINQDSSDYDTDDLDYLKGALAAPRNVRTVSFQAYDDLQSKTRRRGVQAAREDKFQNTAALHHGRNTALYAVRVNGSSLGVIDEYWKSDRDIVMAAVVQDPHALRFASRSLRADVCAHV